ncbi:MAG: hypothetical protein KDE34_25460, partial [Anaerolineales bacterium]|nr:hypothetical protein [Anaerolineales bacterium]
HRLMAGRGLRGWLEWPTDRFTTLASGDDTSGGLLFGCRGDDWARQQLLRLIWLVAGSRPDTFLVATGLPWAELDLPRSELTVMGNGPLAADATAVLVAPKSEQLAVLTGRFLNSDPRLDENLALLRPGEGIVVDCPDQPYPITWQPHERCR